MKIYIIVSTYNAGAELSTAYHTDEAKARADYDDRLIEAKECDDPTTLCLDEFDVETNETKTLEFAEGVDMDW